MIKWVCLWYNQIFTADDANFGALLIKSCIIQHQLICLCMIQSKTSRDKIPSSSLTLLWREDGTANDKMKHANEIMSDICETNNILHGPNGYDIELPSDPQLHTYNYNNKMILC